MRRGPTRLRDVGVEEGVNLWRCAHNTRFRWTLVTSTTSTEHTKYYERVRRIGSGGCDEEEEEEALGVIHGASNHDGGSAGLLFTLSLFALSMSAALNVNADRPAPMALRRCARSASRFAATPPGVWLLIRCRNPTPPSSPVRLWKDVRCFADVRLAKSSALPLRGPPPPPTRPRLAPYAMHPLCDL